MQHRCKDASGVRELVTALPVQLSPFDFAEFPAKLIPVFQQDMVLGEDCFLPQPRPLMPAGQPAQRSCGSPTGHGAVQRHHSQQHWVRQT